ncbi:MAG: hypothetical protein DMG45_26010 [Acidobacteria bacterium]|nr:MAG: hypothetical protein DMG45_26010 [Acidobacteriota bacterium]
MALAAQTAYAEDRDGQFAQSRCPAGQAIQGVDFATRTLICIPVGGSADIAPLLARLTALESDAANERNARLAADNALQASIGSETAARAAADTTLQSNINAEAITRIAEDGTTLASAKAYTDTKVAAGGGGALSFLQPYISLDVNSINGVSGPHIIFSGANVHVRSGSGSTDDNNTPTGLGNLFVGYDEQQTEAVSRTGSHNLIVGGQHSFTRYGGLAAGAANTLDGVSAFAAGVRNVASGDFSSVTGGAGNFAGGGSSSISGGQDNQTTAVASSVSGGRGNLANGLNASVTGGDGNFAAGEASTVSGGRGNNATSPFQHVP